jgi:hypothetical protein
LLVVVRSRLFVLVQVVAVLGFVKGMSPGRTGLIFVGIVLLPLLGVVITALRWTDGEAIDERLGKLAAGQAVVLFLLDVALLIVMLDKPKC